jgi:hypothetical protein
MTRKNWKRVIPKSATEAIRFGLMRAKEEKNLSTEGVSNHMGQSHDSMYKWAATGRMPAILIPAFELACGCNFVSTWLATSAGKLVVDMPTGRTATQADMVELNSGFAAALQLLTNFYADPAHCDAAQTLAALTCHLQQVAYHQHNVAQYTHPELDF